MKKILSVSLLVVGLFFACKNKGENSKKLDVETKPKLLIIENITIDSSYLGCNTKNENCTYISLKYPRIKQAPIQAFMDSVNLAIDNFVMAPIFETKQKTPADLINYFFDNYKKMEVGEFKLPWYLNRNIIFNNLGNGIFTLNCNENAFYGGAHDSWNTEFYNFDSLGKKILLNDLFNENWENRLLEVGEREFKIQQKIHPETPLYETPYFDFPFTENRQFKFANNFLIKNEGLYFFYNNYEIASFAAGQSEFTIKWKDLKALINPNGPLAFMLDSL